MGPASLRRKSGCFSLFSLKRIVKDFFISGKLSHAGNFISEHTIDFVAHVFLVRSAEMDSYPIGGLTDPLNKGGWFGFNRRGISFFSVHIIIFLSGLKCPYTQKAPFPAVVV